MVSIFIYIYFCLDLPTDKLLDQISKRIIQPEKFLVGHLGIDHGFFNKHMPADVVYRKCSQKMMSLWYESNAGTNTLKHLKEGVSRGWKRRAISREQYEEINDTITRESLVRKDIGRN